MSGILMDLCLPTVDTVVHNSCVLFAQLCSVSSNKIVLWFDTIGVAYVRFLASFFPVYVYSLILFYFLWTFV